MTAIEIIGLTKNYKQGATVVRALEGIDLAVEPGEFIAIVGRSGSGKTTLLDTMGLLLRPTAGRVVVDGIDVTGLGDRETSELRRKKIGFVFQEFQLLPTLTALENVTLPLRYAPATERRFGVQRAAALLTEVGVEERMHHRPTELSGGEQQRVAIARALINRPAVVLADEPTGEVDTETSDALLAVMRRMNQDHGVTFVIVTHDLELAGRADRVIRLSDGRVISDERIGGTELPAQRDLVLVEERPMAAVVNGGRGEERSTPRPVSVLPTSAHDNEGVSIANQELDRMELHTHHATLSTDADRPGRSADDGKEYLLPRRISPPARLGIALQALVSPRAVPQAHRLATAPGNGRFPSPRDLTLSPSPSPVERMRLAWRSSGYLYQLDEAIARPRLRRCATIAIVSPKGGVGKTTITALLGTLFAMLRRDRIVAIDTNPDFGSLGRALTPEHHTYVDDLLQNLDCPDLTVTALDSRLGRAAHGLMVLPAPTEPDRMARLDQDAYTRVIRRLQDLVGVVLLDCGTGLQEPAARAALATADQIVLVTDAEPAAASLVAEAAQLLHQDTAPMLLAVNKMPSRGARLNVQALASHVPLTTGLVTIPPNVKAASDLARGEFTWTDAPAPWQVAVREMATLLTAVWPTLGLTLENA